MKSIRCQNCSAQDLIEENGVVTCTYCRSRFIVQASDLPPTKAVIEISADVAALLQKCQQDPVNRRRYANLILDIDPNNVDALAYLR